MANVELGDIYDEATNSQLVLEDFARMSGVIICLGFDKLNFTEAFGKLQQAECNTKRNR